MTPAPLNDETLTAIAIAAASGLIHYHPGYHEKIPAIIAELRRTRARAAKLERVADAARAWAFDDPDRPPESFDHSAALAEMRAALADLDQTETTT